MNIIKAKFIAVICFLFCFAQIFCGCTANTKPVNESLTLCVRTDSGTVYAECARNEVMASVSLYMQYELGNANSVEEALVAVKQTQNNILLLSEAAMRASGYLYKTEINVGKNGVSIVLGKGCGSISSVNIYPQNYSEQKSEHTGIYKSLIRELTGI